MTSETQTDSGVEQKETSKGAGDGSQSKEISLVESANLAAERLEKANKRAEELVKEQQKLATREILGGRTAGAPQIATKVEESPQEYARRALRGEIPLKK